MPLGNNHFHHFQETARSSFAAGVIYFSGPLGKSFKPSKKGGML
jgi:hypothetical protein